MTGLGQSILEEGIECGMERGIEYGMERGMERGIEYGMERGMERGIERGRVQGIEHGMNRILQMNQRLLQEKRYADLERATSDQAFRESLFAELFPETAAKQNPEGA